VPLGTEVYVETVVEMSVVDLVKIDTSVLGGMYVEIEINIVVSVDTEVVKAVYDDTTVVVEGVYATVKKLVEGA
jgi:hypothetical protein